MFTDVVYWSLDVVDGDMPLIRGEWLDLRDALIDAFIPMGSVDAISRREKLKNMIQSNPQRKWITVYRRGGMSERDKWAFAEEFADNALPRRLGTLKRQRWLTSTRPIQEVAFLGGTFDLLDRILLHWYRRIRGLKPLPMLPDRDPVVVEDPLSDEEGPAPEAGPPMLKDGTPDWSAWNRGQQRSVERFRRNKPSGPAACVALGTEGLAALARWLTKIHGEAWDLLQRSNFAEGERFTPSGR